MDVETVFVTGANRGIGLEFVRQLAQLPKPPKFIFGTYRNRNTVQELKSIRDASKETKILLIKMDITNLDNVRGARKIVEDMVGDLGLTLLINNAGVAKSEEFPKVSEENLLFHFKTNTVGPITVLQEFLPLLQIAADRPNMSSGKSVSKSAVLNISSLAGSITRGGLNSPVKIPGEHGYRISKAALNMAMREISADLDDKGILVVLMCPGWVKTDMGGKEEAELELSESISSMLKTLPTLNESHHGTFIDRNGENYEF